MAAIRIWDVQKGAQLQDTLGRGCAWYAGQNIYYSRSRSDCSQACRLIEGIDAEYLLADQGYDSDALVTSLQQAEVSPVIPPRKSRKLLRHYDRYLYRLRHLIENTLLELKRWRGIATRYAKNKASFLAAVHIRCIAIWAKIK